MTALPTPSPSTAGLARIGPTALPLPARSGGAGGFAEPKPGPRTGHMPGPGPARFQNREDWVPISVAAPLLAVSEAQLRRRCQEEYHGRGLARKLTLAIGGRPVWHVRADASPRLLRRPVEISPSGTSSVTDLLASTTAAQRQQAEHKARIVAEFRAWRSRPGVRVRGHAQAFVLAVQASHGLAVSLSQLYRWDAACPTTEDHAGCVAALIDRRGRRSSGPTASDTAWRMFADLYLSPQQRSVASCHDIVRARAQREGWSWPTLRTVQRMVTDRITPETACIARQGMDAWRKRHEAPIDQDPEAWAVGQCWEADKSTLDFEARVPRADGWARVRPVLTMWIDRRSRAITGWHIGAPADEEAGSRAIRLALLSALKDGRWSVPEVVWLDNGKDFASAAMAGTTKADRAALRRGHPPMGREADEDLARRASSGLLRLLGIEIHWAQPYNHNAKARIERRFGFIHERFDREVHTWLGSRAGMTDRREREDRIRAAGGESSLPTLDEVRQTFAGFVDWFNARDEHRIDDLRDPHTRVRLSPQAFYDRHLPARRTLPDPVALRLLEAEWTRPLKVHKWGLSVPMGGSIRRYGEDAAGRVHPTLSPLVGSQARVLVSYDPMDVSTITAWDIHGRLLGDISLNGLSGGVGPLSREAVRRGAAKRREQRREARRRVDMTALGLTDAQLAVREQREMDIARTRRELAERLGDLAPTDPAPLRLVRTPLDGQAAALQDQRAALAAGAEHDLAPDRSPEPASGPAGRARLDLARYAELASQAARAGHDDDVDPSGPVPTLLELAAMRSGATQEGHDDEDDPARGQPSRPDPISRMIRAARADDPDPPDRAEPLDHTAAPQHAYAPGSDEASDQDGADPSARDHDTDVYTRLFEAARRGTP